MADITMCMTTNCPKKDNCYRCKAIPDKLQSYADFTDVCYKNDYEYFWDMSKMRMIENTDRHLQSVIDKAISGGYA